MVFLKGLLKKKRVVDEPKKKGLSGSLRHDVYPCDLWEIVGELGDGAFGKVYEAVKKGEGTEAALKKVEFGSEVELEDFMVEIEILTQLKHKNIISLLEVYVYDSKLWMFLELCKGGALDSIMNTLEKPLSESQIKFVTHEVLCGLGFLHENLIIHRDMKAGNILLTQKNEVKLADFGVSARLNDAKQKRDTFIGTPYWMAPEVIACETFKSNAYNWKADIWSLGITLIELAQTRPPYHEINPTRVLLKIAKSDPPTLSRPNFWSQEFRQMLVRCLQKDPAQRPECKELLLDPFVCDVSEADRKYIQLLLCELRADVVDTVEDVEDISLLPAEEQIPPEPVLVLPDSTEITVPMEIQVDDEFESDLSDQKEMMFDILPPEPIPQIDIPTEPRAGVSGGPDKPTSTPVRLPDKSVVDSIVHELADELIDEVVTSETQHPSIPSCLFEVMRDISQEDDVVEPAAVSTPVDRKSHPTPSVMQSPTQRNQMSASANRESSGISRQNSMYQTLTRTRRFVVNGQQITTTTKKVIRNNAVERKLNEQEANKRKAELRAFRMLGKREARRTRDLAARASLQQEQLEAKLSAEFMTLHRGYEQNLETVSRNYRAQMERLEKEFEVEAKRIRSESAKSERSLGGRRRQEIHNAFRSERKSNKGSLFPELAACLNSQRSCASTGNTRLTLFGAEEQTEFNSKLVRLADSFQSRFYNLRQAEVLERQDLRMNFEQDKWKMDQRHMRMRHQLARSRLQDFFRIKREKLAGFLDLELSELRQSIASEREKLSAVHAIERKNEMKQAKVVGKQNLAAFQKQLRTTQPSNVKERLREFEHNARKQLAEKLFELECRQRNQQELLEKSIFMRLRELELSHAERRNNLVELETERLQELDNEHDRELRAYVDSLPRNQALLRQQFAEEMANLSLGDDLGSNRLRQNPKTDIRSTPSNNPPGHQTGQINSHDNNQSALSSNYSEAQM
ncbi:unnamed protein product [Calicophoron daubneyi]|uniref:Protein kinase domain-containing protein n=1 Tax=Calicophoron daubneyi TaxID=300641 RepID=A0AAV2TMZ7_CALDB